MKNLLQQKEITTYKNKLDLQHKSCKITCAKTVVETLISLGVTDIFGYPGAAVLSIYNELAGTKIRHILVRHEQAAVHMAEGYAKIKNKPGVVLVTSGPGFTNTVTGIANAYADSTPLIVLAGDVPTGSSGKTFQKTDISAIIKTCSKKIYSVSRKDNVKQILTEAYELANTGKKGPVIITLPRNISESEYIPKAEKEIYKKKLPLPSEAAYNKILRLLHNAKNPLLLLGGGATESVDNIKKFVELTNIPVISTLMGIGIYPSESPDYLGMIGVNGAYSANMAVNQADFILALGVSFSDRSTCKQQDFAKNSIIISVNIEHNMNNSEIEIISDVNMFIQNLIPKISSLKMPDLSEWNKHVQILKQECVKNINTSDSLHSSFVLETIYKYTHKYEPIVVTDVGQHQMLTAQFFNFNKPKHFITSGGLGTMGFGLPASIGAYLANPTSLVLNITGDGSFQMNLQELATCREHNIPIKIVIMNNSYLGMVRQLQEKFYHKCYQVEMINPDFTKIAEAYDLFATRVTGQNELIPALEKALSYKGTAIIDIAIDSFEEI